MSHEPYNEVVAKVRAWLPQSNLMRKKLPVIFAYAALLALALPIPLLHERLADRAIESMRPVMRMSDGTLVSTLMPADLLLLRSLGQFSWFVVWVVAAFLLLSFRRELFERFTAICIVAIGQCAFTTLYAFYVAFLLSEYWIHRAGPNPSH